jgi:hypothetical protein
VRALAADDAVSAILGIARRRPALEVETRVVMGLEYRAGARSETGIQVPGPTLRSQSTLSPP